MGVAEYLTLIGAFFIIPIWYDLFKGTEALKEILKNKKKRVELFILSALSTEIVWTLIKVYLMVKQLPLSTKY